MIIELLFKLHIIDRAGVWVGVRGGGERVPRVRRFLTLIHLNFIKNRKHSKKPQKI